MTADASVVDVPAPESDSDRRGAGSTEEVTSGYVRSPQDALRLTAFAIVGLLLFGLTIGIEDSILAFEEDLVNLFGFLNSSSERILNGAAEATGVVVAIAVYLVPLFTRRYRLFGYIILSGASAALLILVAQLVLDRQSSSVVANELAERAGIAADTATSTAGLAQLAAIFIALGPFVARAWRRTGMLVLASLVLVRVLVAPDLPAEVFMAVPLGAACGAGVLLALGRPDRRPTLSAIGVALANAGLPTTEVHPAKVDARGSTPYFATLTDGTALFVKVLGSEERAADLMFRVYRFLRLRDVGDDRPFSSLRRAVEHEALIALIARDVGIRTPRLRGVVDVGADSMLLAYEMIDGSSVDGVPDDAITDDLMRGVWSEVALLRSHRIAHRDLRRANVFVAASGEPWMIDFGFSEIAVEDPILDADVAQLLASFAVVTGAERAVSVAVDVLGAGAVGASLHRLQPRALSGATQTALKRQKGLLAQLQHEVISQCGVEQVQYDQLDRINSKTIVTVGVLVLATYFLLPQFADIPGIVDQVRDANWWWTPLILVGSVSTYFAAAAALSGAIPDRLPAGPLVATTLASSFASKLAPAGLGGMALSARFLQKQGVDRAVAVSGVGLNTVAGIAGHLILIGVFLVWAGREAFGSISLPDPKWFLVGLGVAVAMIVVGLLIPRVRAIMRARLLPVLARSFDGVSATLRRPGKVIALVGGSVVLTFAYLVTLYFSIEAFGGGLPFAAVGAVYLVGSAVAQAAPTPGGLGAVEAALIGGLVAAGLDDSVAVPSVFLFRLFTFWIPVLPGYISFQWLERNEYI